MSPENAKLVESLIALFLLIYCLLLFTEKIPLKKKPAFFEKYKKVLIWMGAIGICYPIYEILSVLFKWK
jgi:hypothetical protein